MGGEELGGGAGGGAGGEDQRQMKNCAPIVQRLEEISARETWWSQNILKGSKMED